MARRKRTPERSKLVRAHTPAFSRRQRTGGGDDDDDPEHPRAKTAEPTETTETEIQPIAAPAVAAPTDKTPPEGHPVVPEARDAIETQPLPMTPAHTRADAVRELPAIDPPAPKAEPWPDATPQPMRPVRQAADDEPRPRAKTMLAVPTGEYGRPPEMPKTTAPPPLVLGEVENPAHMPGPKEIPGGNPEDPAPAPGMVPPGDSRSLRRGNEFALVYRVGTCVITRTGRLGTRGQWRVVEYPTSIFAANSYAKECSRFVTDGFSDYRE